MTIPHNRLTYGIEEEKAVLEVVKSGRWAGGNYTNQLEEKLGQYTKSNYVAAVSSGISALRLALLGIGVTTNDEVIIPAYSCVALANAILSIGAIPVPVDIEKNTYNIDIECIKKAITSKTKVIIAVHTFGQPSQIEEIISLGYKVIEDCAHCLGIDYTGKHTIKPNGNWADAAITSFYATKLIGAGEGGAVLSSDFSVIDLIKQYRDYSDQMPSAYRLNDKMNDLEAALAFTQLQKLDAFNQRRTAIAERYLSELKNVIPISSLPTNEIERVWYRFVIKLPHAISLTKFKDYMWEKYNIKTDEPVFSWHKNIDSSKLPNTAKAFEQCLSIPCYPTLTEEEQSYIIESIKQTVQYFN